MPMSDKFPTVDISHKPRRMQADNIARANSQAHEETPQNAPVESPKSVHSLESAIRYYKENATGENTLLYTATSAWLSELLDLRATPKCRREESESSDL